MTNTSFNSKPSHPVITTGWLVTIVMLLIVGADQVVKFYVKTHFYLGEAYDVFPWFQIKFIENNGMAFGMELFNKFILTFGRIGAVIFFIWFIKKALGVTGLRKGFYIACGLITAGAAGNIFDCIFYGEIFNNPFPPEHAVLFPAGGGYAGWFEGRVVDMLYFPFFSFTWPSWIPGIGGKEYEFFQYIFNIADASICVGVALLILFFSSDCSKAFNAVFESKENKGNENNPAQ